jgi:excisionase family DNA binding protein
MSDRFPKESGQKCDCRVTINFNASSLINFRGNKMQTFRKEILTLREAGLTLKAIGRKMGISAERVRQIINRKDTKKERPSEIETPLSTGDVALLLNIHTNTVRRWSRSGILKTYRVGPRGDRRFLQKDVRMLFHKSKG